MVKLFLALFFSFFYCLGIFFILVGFIGLFSGTEIFKDIMIVISGILVFPFTLSYTKKYINKILTFSNSSFNILYILITFFIVVFSISSSNNTQREIKETTLNDTKKEELIESVDKGIIKKEEPKINEKHLDIVSENNIEIEEEKEKVYQTLYIVKQIIDGDTIDIIYNGEVKRLRLIGIDSPENTTLRNGNIECYGKESKEYMKSILSNKKISLEFDSSQGNLDPYGRMLVYIFLGETNINQKIINNGYAYEYTYNKTYKYINDFKKAQEYAKNNKLGLWASNTCDGERIIKEEEIVRDSISNTIIKKEDLTIKKDSNITTIEDIPIYEEKEFIDTSNCIIKGNISYKNDEKIYHVPGCQSYNATKISTHRGERWFCTEQEAINAGWRKAKNCY